MGTEEEQKQALNDYLSASQESMRYRKKMIVKKIIIIISIVPILFYFLFNNPFIYIFMAKKDLRYYEIFLNNYKLSVSEEIQNTVIVPNLISLPNGNSIKFSFENKNAIIDKPFILDIKSYTCFISNNNKKIKTSCDEKISIDDMYENKDTEYSSMKILKYDYDPIYEYSVNNNYLSQTYEISENSWRTRPVEEYITIYDDEFIKDLTSYISEPGVYVIKLNFHYKSTTGTLSFGLVYDGEKLLTL